MDSAPSSLQWALSRGHWWLAILELGEVKIMLELATRKGMDNSYVYSLRTGC